MLNHLANEDDMTGEDYATKLISGAISHVEGDVKLSASEGVSVQNSVYVFEKKCTYGDTLSSFGVVLLNYFRSAYSSMVIPSLSFKAAFDGEFVIVLDDGKAPVTVTATAVFNQEVTIDLTYSTKQAQVKIYAQDATKQFCVLECPKHLCSNCSAKVGTLLILKGYNRLATVSTPVGFIPDAYVTCNADEVLCYGVNQNKALFSKAIAYKVGVLAYTRLLLSPRMNDTTLNIDKDAAQTYLNTLEAKYRELMFGSAKAYGNAATTGIVSVIRAALKNRNDRCVVCTSAMYSTSATF